MTPAQFKIRGSRADLPALDQETELERVRLPGTEFGQGNYRRCDLRGNDVPAISGAHHLKHIVLDQAQLLQLADALSAELGVSFGDEASAGEVS